MYIGDPINAVRIFSEKEVDETVVLDICASRDGREPNYQLIEELAGEAFMPLAYGGGIRTLDQIRRLIRSGVEKVVINSAAAESTSIIREAADIFGSQAVVAAIDIRRSIFGKYRVVTKSGTIETKLDLYAYVEHLVSAGVGEIFVNNIDLDGTMKGYDLPLIRSITELVNVPVVACGGAGSTSHLFDGIHAGGASAVAAGSMFVFHGKHKAVLISYPTSLEIDQLSSVQ